MNLLKLFVSGIVSSICFIICANYAFAGKISEGVSQFGSKVFGTGYTPPQQIAALIIQVVLTFLGIIFVALIIYGGFIYMTAMGEGEKVKKGKNVILYAVIGLIIVISAYAITNFLVTNILNSAGGGIYGSSQGGGLDQGGTTP